MVGKVTERTLKWGCGAEESADTLIPAVWVEIPERNGIVNVLLADKTHNVGDQIKVSWLRVQLTKLLKDL